MEKRNTILLTIIAVSTLLVAVVGATFAYFASNVNTNNNIAVNVNTSNKTATFIAKSDGNIEIKVDSYEMQQGDVGDGTSQSSNTDYANGLTANATLNVTLLASDEGKETTCSYDVIYTWDDKSAENFKGKVSESSGKGIPSEYYIRTKSETTEGFKELTIEGDISAGVEGDSSNMQTGTYESIGEKNIDEFPAREGDTDKKVLVLEDQTITSVSTTKATYHNYTFTVKFYNLKENQSDLMGKTFAGTISVDNVHC